MMERACVAFLVVAQLALATSPARGQDPAPRSPAPDSVETAAEARRAQRRFEGIRRAALPIADRRGPSPCEVRLGRYCYWYDASARPPAPREAVTVTPARQRFLQVLDSLGARSPTDTWIVGQRVRYRIDALDTAGAVAVATSSCSTPGWWCDALRGYALHVAGRYDAAGDAFDEALAAMPAEDRCAWENPTILLEARGRDRVQRLSCEARREVAERLWWLGDPQLVRPGNDLRTEFLARRVASVLEADARFVYGTRWSWDTNELLLRYGWPTWWTRERSYAASGTSQLLLVGHEPVPAFDFLPGSRAVLAPPGAMRNGDWAPARRLPTMRYAPPYLVWWRDAPAQVARLRRGDTLLVVAAFDVPPDSMLRRASGTLALSTGPRRAPLTSPSVRGGRGVLQARIPLPAAGTEVLASVEVVDEARRAMARHRLSFTEPATARLALSDLLLHHPLDDPPAAIGLGDVIGHLLPGTEVAADRVGVYWETYGVPAGGEMLSVALTIERMDTPWLRRAAARLRLADPITPVQIRWRASPRRSGQAVAQSVAVHLANMGRGEYRLRLRVEGEDGARATSEQVVRIVGN